MNKAVMISIRPEWCARIAFNEKTVEVRKTRPKIEPPFPCYIYCSKTGKHLFYHSNGDGHNRITKNEEARINLLRRNGHTIFNGTVFGEFVCDAIFTMSVRYSDPTSEIAFQGFPYTGMTDREIMGYLGNGKSGYGWHISDLVIYDTPRPLSDFGLSRPPQSWCYVKEVTT